MQRGCFLIDEVNCDISDMPCHASYRATAFPTAAPVFMTPSPSAAPSAAPSATPTAAPTIAPTLEAATPAPTSGSRGGIGLPTSSPTTVLDAEELDADDADVDDADADDADTDDVGGEGASNGIARVTIGLRETILAVVVGGGAFFSGALGLPLAL